MTTLTVKEKARLADWENAAGFEPVAEQELFMDSHGCNVVLMVLKREDDEEYLPLHGFTYRYSSEERFFEDDPMELVELVGKPVTKVEYSRADGDDWQEHI